MLTATCASTSKGALPIQVNKNTKQVQDRKAKAAPRYADDTNASSDAPKRWSDYTVQFEFPEPTELPPPLIQLNDVSFQYPGRDDFGLKDLNIGVDMGSRVAIVGPNGAGKTTLMNLLSGMSASYLLLIYISPAARLTELTQREFMCLEKLSFTM